MPLTADRLARLRRLVAEITPAIRRLRRELHTQPEIHLQEFKTRQRLAEALRETSIAWWQPLLETDLIGELPGPDDRRICLRADIDALPIEEQTGAPYRSTVPGMMHACGHDGHMSMMVGTAMVLDQLRDWLPVGVRFVFQPGEESVAGGRDLVAKGACDGTEAAFALHGGPGRPVGTVSAMPGAMLAAAGFFTMEIHGRGGHAATPHLAHSPLPAAATCITRLQALHEELNAAHGAVVTVAAIHGGDASNVIPDSVRMIGTTRYLQPELGPLVESRLREVAATVAAAAGVRIEVGYEATYELPLINAPSAVDYLRQIVVEHLGQAVWRPEPGPTMVSEDFAFYLKDRPGAMFWLGLGEDYPKLHSPRFDFNDDVLETGILTFCLIALNYQPLQQE